jgi:actin-related protein 5
MAAAPPAPAPAAPATSGDDSIPTIHAIYDSVALPPYFQVYNPMSCAEYKSRYACKRKRVPIVLDFGSHEFRAGWADEEQPRVQALSLVVRPKNTHRGASHVLVGHQLHWLENPNGRSPFESNVLNYIEAVEHVLDYVFDALGLSNCDAIDHPIFITECPCNPAFSRKQLIDLLFSAYQVHGVCFGVDMALAYQRNRHAIAANASGPGASSLSIDDCITVCVGHNTTHIVPVLDGKFQWQHMHRIGVGGLTCSQVLLRLIRFNYPHQRQWITEQRAAQLFEQFGLLASDSYQSEINLIEQHSSDAVPRVVIQLPLPVKPAKKAETEEEVKAKEQRRELNRQRFLQQLAEARVAKIAKYSEQSASFQGLIEQFESGAITREQFDTIIADGGFDDEKDLRRVLRDVQKKLNNLLRKSAEEDPQSQQSIEEMFPLMFVDDSELDADQLRRKRVQRMQKAGHEAMLKRRQEKEIQRQEEEAKLAEEERFRKENPELYLKNLHERRAMLLRLREKRTHRRTQKEIHGKRDATKRRIRILASINQTQQEESFGADDAHWNVYRQVQKHEDVPADGDSDAEQQELEMVEEKLRKHDPTV